MKKPKLIAFVLLALTAGLGVRPAYAHAFGERYDLPLPLNFFLVGGAAVVALSFVVIGFFVQRRSEAFRYPRYNLLNNSVIGPVISNRVFLFLVKVVPVLVFLLLFATAFAGTNKPLDNFSTIFVWVIWWVGMGYIAALLGNFWMLINPWKIIYEWGQKLLGEGSGREETPMFRYPERLDVWPALVLFGVFAWTENVFTGATVPAQLGILVLLYSIITWGGMLFYGKHTWLRHGEAFSVLFGFFSRFSPTEVRVTDSRVCRNCSQECNVSDNGCVDCYECFEEANYAQREFNLRPYAVGLVDVGRITTATAVFVIAALATVTFDGLGETGVWLGFQSSVFSTVSGLGSGALGVIDTAGLILMPLIFIGVYMLFAWGIRELSGEGVPVSDVAKAFVFSLVPIALAYNLAHFLSLLLIQGQLIVPLLSDPFGFGWDIFGTADYRLNINVVNARFIWFISLSAIVLGHIVSVFIAHLIALRRVPDHRFALRGQYPMLALMVFYTATSLWIIAQPIVAG